MSKRILIINGSLSGNEGNTAHILEKAEEYFEQRLAVDRLSLLEQQSYEKQLALCQSASGFLFGTGTYWGSCGSVLQKFFEQATESEGSELWLGKPAGVVVSAHSAGAEMVLARLQLTLTMYGALPPPNEFNDLFGYNS